jgi:Fur family transcriptional regulator, iron response regulator
MDIPPTDVMVGQAPAPPEGFEITRIDVVVRLRQKTKRHGE